MIKPGGRGGGGAKGAERGGKEQKGTNRTCSRADGTLPLGPLTHCGGPDGGAAGAGAGAGAARQVPSGGRRGEPSVGAARAGWWTDGSWRATSAEGSHVGR